MTRNRTNTLILYHVNVSFSTVANYIGVAIMFSLLFATMTPSSNPYSHWNIVSFVDATSTAATTGSAGAAAADPTTSTTTTTTMMMMIDGVRHLENGKNLFNQYKYDDAASELWKAILLHSSVPKEYQYDVTIVFQQFLQCYSIQNKLGDGFAFVASESFKRGQSDMGRTYLQQALEYDPNNSLALAVQEKFATFDPIVLIDEDTDDTYTESSSTTLHETKKKNKKKKQHNNNKKKNKNNHDLLGQTPEQLYEVASTHFSAKNYEECADIFEISCQRSGITLGPSCVNAVYCRNLLVDWGYNGTTFMKDMKRIIYFTQKEVKEQRFPNSFSIANSNNNDNNNNINNNNNKNSSSQNNNNDFQWERATSVHPHMMLGYPIDPMLKRFAAESASYLDEKMARAVKAVTTDAGLQLPPLPKDLPYDIEKYRIRFVQEKEKEKGTIPNSNYRIRVGFVGSGFNSKAVLFLSHDMFRFFNKSQFEIHVFSFGPPDNPRFIQHGMRGVDWRERVKANADYFHDCQAMKMDHIKAARYIHKHNIHILIEWDGFARQGERAQGLFALRPSPIQVLHQEYLGTSGAHYVDYLFTDHVTSPPNVTHLYTEKLIWMPNHFFSKGHAYQEEVMKPLYKYKPKQMPYVFGTGTPIENRCLSPPNVGPSQPSFVYCNFNKLLKANPETVRSWIKILQEVPNSMLCLVENPTAAIPYFRKFVYETIGFDNNNSSIGDDINSRIHFLPWENNPFDHQARNHDMCNIMLDSHPYNGHTVAQDALYGGVPIVTRSDGDDMSSRVTTSANIVLDLDQLNAYEGSRQYEEIAIRLGKNQTEYLAIRKKLVDACLQRNPMHPYFDVARYVKNFEKGLKIAWGLFLDGKKPEHIVVNESPEISRGTYDDEIIAHPPEPKRSSQSNIKVFS